MKFGFMPCDSSTAVGGSYIPGVVFNGLSTRAAVVSGFFCV